MVTKMLRFLKSLFKAMTRINPQPKEMNYDEFVRLESKPKIQFREYY
jgi:hypothetical protein